MRVTTVALSGIPSVESFRFLQPPSIKAGARLVIKIPSGTIQKRTALQGPLFFFIWPHRCTQVTQPYNKSPVSAFQEKDPRSIPRHCQPQISESPKTLPFYVTLRCTQWKKVHRNWLETPPVQLANVVIIHHLRSGLHHVSQIMMHLAFTGLMPWYPSSARFSTGKRPCQMFIIHLTP